MTRRRDRRSLTPEDHALWDRVRATTRPMWDEKPQRREVPEKGPGPEIHDPVRTHRTVIPNPPAPKITWNLAADALSGRGSGPLNMDKRRFDKMKRGRLRPEAKVDLHGMTAERAHSALTHFILSSHASGLRLVLVITGKGRPAEPAHAGFGQYGILRQSVPRWLALPPLSAKTLQVATAHQRHGGDGALYVYLRRSN